VGRSRADENTSTIFVGPTRPTKIRPLFSSAPIRPTKIKDLNLRTPRRAPSPRRHRTLARTDAAPPVRRGSSPRRPFAVPRPRTPLAVAASSPCPVPAPPLASPGPLRARVLAVPHRRAPSACPALAVPAYSSCPIAVTHRHRRLLAVPPRRDPSPCRPSPRRPSPSNKVLT
jgi:hypothetical protein